MRKSVIALILHLFFAHFAFSQFSGTISGTVRDKLSGDPLPHATVSVRNDGGLWGAATDSLGQFIIRNSPVGRYDVHASLLGYEPVIVKEVLISSGKEAFLEIELTESAQELDNIVVRPKINKAQPLNPLALGSARMLSVEEAGRYAGGFDDPAKLATAFAGATGDVGNNGIVIRGNAPKFLQWRLEGVEIPNPNHFAEVTTFGGGGLTALSSQVLGNSDFFTGAFPAEYGNALSGVFDMGLRTGNNRKMENTVQVGLIGIDVASEGPFKANGKSSYIVNYRYSTLDLLSPLMPEDSEGTKYQDLSFKLNFPTENSGTFSVWGIGLIDRSGQTAETDPSLWEYMQDREDQDVKQYMGAAGLNHRVRLGENGVLKTSLAATVSGLDMHTERMDDQVTLIPQNVIKNTNLNFVFSSWLATRFSPMHTNKTGIRLTGLKYNLLLRETENKDVLRTITDESGFSSLLSAYTTSSWQFSDQWTLNLGVNAQWFTLNDRYTVEPRTGLQWKFRPAQSLALSYGLHSRLEMLNYYFTRSDNGEPVNKDLDFTRAHHLVFSYDRCFGENYHLNIEPYFQYLFDVPIIADSTFSMINLQNDWFISDPLVNRGKGMNYGVDVTFEKYISRGYYYLITGSVFDSRYKAGDDKWHNTRYNRNYAFNFLTGKEWMAGAKKQNMFGANIRLTYQGGERFSPVDPDASQQQQDAVHNELNPFSKQLSPVFLCHFTVKYTMNRKKSTHEIALKVLNATNYKDYYGHRYNFKTRQAEPEKEAVMIPNISYKIAF